MTKLTKQVYQSFWVEVVRQTDIINDILTQIANDEIEVFFIAEGYLIAPYDGGLDLIFDSPRQISVFKEKYVNWLSARENGL